MEPRRTGFAKSRQLVGFVGQGADTIDLRLQGIPVKQKPLTRRNSVSTTRNRHLRIPYEFNFNVQVVLRAHLPGDFIQLVDQGTRSLELLEKIPALHVQLVVDVFDVQLQFPERMPTAPCAICKPWTIRLVRQLACAATLRMDFMNPT